MDLRTLARTPVTTAGERLWEEFCRWSRPLDPPLRRVAVWAWVLLPLLAAVVGSATRKLEIIDYGLFGRVGVQMLRGDLGSVYADPIVQAGALELLFFAPFYALDGVIPELGHLLYITLGSGLVMFGVMHGVRWLRRAVALPDNPAIELVAGALALPWELFLIPLFTGHPSEFAIPALWLWAAVAARRDRAVLAGVLVGCSAGWETWGLLAAPVLLLAPGLRRVVVAGMAMLGTLAVLFVPFVLSGNFEMLAFSWKVDPDTLPGQFMADPNGGFSWWWRLAQAVLAILACTVVARRLHRSWDAVWLAPLAAVVVRLVFDPIHAYYYWLPAQYLALWGLGVAGRIRHRTALVVAVLCWWFSTPAGQTWIGTAVVSVPTVAWLVREVSRQSQAQVPEGQVLASDSSDRIPAPRRPAEGDLDRNVHDRAANPARTPVWAGEEHGDNTDQHTAKPTRVS